MHAEQNFAKDITAVFNSDLLDEFKFDIVCRMVSEILGATSVSMLIYHGRVNKLICKGSYVNPDRADYTEPNSIEEKLLRNIAVFDFFNSIYYNKGKTELHRSFLGCCISDKNISPISVEEFNKLHEKWISDPVYKQAYKAYRNTFKNDAYDIEKESISGTFFTQLLKNPGELTSQEKILDLKAAIKKQPIANQYFEVLQSVGIELFSDTYYIGLPLFATERYWGILRIIISKKDVEDIVLTEVDSKLSLTSISTERLRNFAQLISLHLETSYYLNGYKTLSTLEVSRENIKKICENIVDILNCSGAMIRLKSEYSSLIEIAGYSTTLAEYIDFINSDEWLNRDKSNKTFSESIVDIFAKGKYEGCPILAICFSIKDIQLNQFETVEYYYDNFKDLQKVNNERILTDFEPVYNTKLLELGISQIAVFVMPFVTGGYVVLTNTNHRPFTASDVEMVALAVKRIGLEIKHNQDMAENLEMKRQEAFYSSMNIIVHQASSLISASANNTYNLVRHSIFRNIYPDNKIPGGELEHVRKRINELGFALEKSKQQLLRSKRLIELDGQEKIEVRENKIPDFKRYLFNKCRDFEAGAYAERGLHVWLIDQGDAIKGLNIDSNLFDEVMFNLLDNAIKYSYHGHEMKKHGLNFDENIYHSEGNVLIYFYNGFDRVEIKVTNWGPPIPPAQRLQIFEKYFRGGNSDSQIGSGIGLFLVKRIIDAMRGKINLEIVKDKITFIIQFNR